MDTSDRWTPSNLEATICTAAELCQLLLSSMLAPVYCTISTPDFKYKSEEYHLQEHSNGSAITLMGRRWYNRGWFSICVEWCQLNQLKRADRHGGGCLIQEGQLTLFSRIYSRSDLLYFMGQ